MVWVCFVAKKLDSVCLICKWVFLNETLRELLLKKNLVWGSYGEGIDVWYLPCEMKDSAKPDSNRLG